MPWMFVEIAIELATISSKDSIAVIFRKTQEVFPCMPLLACFGLVGLYLKPQTLKPEDVSS